MPPAIPSDIAEELISYHKAPEVGVIIQSEFKMTRGIIEFEYYISSTHLPLEPDKIFSYGDLLYQVWWVSQMAKYIITECFQLQQLNSITFIVIMSDILISVSLIFAFFTFSSHHMEQLEL